jgi:hypothetical protein
MNTYVVGGTPRSGKSTLRKLFLENHKTSGISTDLLRDSFEEGIPEVGIRDGQSDMEKSEILWPYFKSMLTMRRYYKDDLVIEGTNFLPKYLAEFKGDQSIKICFLGFTDISPEDKLQEIREFASPDDDWTNDLSDESLLETIKDFVKQSNYYKEECEKYGIGYFDTSTEFHSMVNAAEKYLTGEPILDPSLKG